MKRPIIVILSALILISIYFVFFRNTNSAQDLNFNIADTSQITKLIVSDKLGKVQISKVTNQWMVNENFHANQQLIKQLFRLFKNLELNVLAPDLESKILADSIQNSGIKLEFYNNDDLTRRYWIGKFDEKYNSTLILTDDDVVAYVTAIGLSKNISQFVKADDIFWRDKLLFGINPEEISEVNFLDINKSENSFKIEKKIDNWLLFNSKQEKFQASGDKISQYLSYFNNISFESLADEFVGKKCDSLLARQPVYIIKLKTKKDKTLQLKLYQKYSDKNYLEPDLDYIYGNLNNEKLVLLITYFQIDPILKQIDYFK
jgi:hypothetical protein